MCSVCVSVLESNCTIFPPDHHYEFDKLGRPIGAIELQIGIVLVNSESLLITDLNFPLRRTQK